MKRKTSNKVLTAAIAAIILFWFSEIGLLLWGQSGFPDRFITCWFTFWSVELAALAGIKITKVRHSPYTNDEIEEEANG